MHYECKKKKLKKKVLLQIMSSESAKALEVFVFQKAAYLCKQIILNHSKQHGAAEARWAGCPEVPRSKRGVARASGFELRVVRLLSFYFSLP